MAVTKYLSLIVKVLRFVMRLTSKKESEKEPLKPLEKENKS